MPALSGYSCQGYLTEQELHHARPAAEFAQTATASAVAVTSAKQGGNAVNAGSILSVMGLGIKQRATQSKSPWTETTRPSPTRYKFDENIGTNRC